MQMTAQALAIVLAGASLGWIALFSFVLSPVAFIVTTVLCFNFLGDGLRDAADPYGSR